MHLLDARDRGDASSSPLAGNQPVANPLMGSSLMVVVDELTDDVVEVGQAEDDEVVEGLVLQALNPPLDECVQVRRPRGRLASP